MRLKKESSMEIGFTGENAAWNREADRNRIILDERLIHLYVQVRPKIEARWPDFGPVAPEKLVV